MCTEETYKYTATNGQCHNSGCTIGVPKGGVTGYKDVAHDDENALMEAVAKGPVSIAIEADKSVFQLSAGGRGTPSLGGGGLRAFEPPLKAFPIRAYACWLHAWKPAGATGLWPSQPGQEESRGRKPREVQDGRALVGAVRRPARPRRARGRLRRAQRPEVLEGEELLGRLVGYGGLRAPRARPGQRWCPARGWLQSQRAG